MRVVIDVESISRPTPELLTILKQQDEIDPILLVRNEEKSPSGWINHETLLGSLSTRAGDIRVAVLVESVTIES